MNAQLTGTAGSAFDGDTLVLGPRNGTHYYGFQKGLGANDKNGNEGASTWFDFSGSYSGFGDFNLTLSCNMAPRVIMANIQFQTAVNQPLSQDLSTFVYDPEGSPLTFSVIPTNALTGVGGLPQHGSLNLQNSGQFVYTPQQAYQGPDAFGFRAVDNGSPAAFVDGTVNFEVGNNSLPLSWVSFTAQKAENAAVDLRWLTSNESNSDYFVVEKSADLEQFHALSRVKAENLSGIQSYEFTDRTAMESVNYYRLKQVDLDGSYSYSSTIEVAFDNELAEQIQLYPNPAKDQIGLQLPIGKYELNLFDPTGRNLQQSAFEVQFADHNHLLNIQDLSKGMYMISIRNQLGHVSVKHFVKQ
ncbi:MAG: T9SS type A sorting domain-containing protein [Bacteroidia bacterium]